MAGDFVSIYVVEIGFEYLPMDHVKMCTCLLVFSTMLCLPGGKGSRNYAKLR